jgi:hypothetical protein
VRIGGHLGSNNLSFAGKRSTRASFVPVTILNVYTLSYAVVLHAVTPSQSMTQTWLNLEAVTPNLYPRLFLSSYATAQHVGLQRPCTFNVRCFAVGGVGVRRPMRPLRCSPANVSVRLQDTQLLDHMAFAIGIHTVTAAVSPLSHENFHVLSFFISYH